VLPGFAMEVAGLLPLLLRNYKRENTSCFIIWPFTFRYVISI
jgi:hypothetical protein